MAKRGGGEWVGAITATAIDQEMDGVFASIAAARLATRQAKTRARKAAKLLQENPVADLPLAIGGGGDGACDGTKMEVPSVGMRRIPGDQRTLGFALLLAEIVPVAPDKNGIDRRTWETLAQSCWR